MYHPLVSEDGKVDVMAVIPQWSYGEKCQVFDLLMRFKKIFGELSYLRNRDSYNPDAAILFDTGVETYLEKVEKDCTKSAAEFNNHYDGCPYAHTTREVPDNVKDLLHNQTLSLEEKKAKLRDLLLAKTPAVPAK